MKAQIESTLLSLTPTVTFSYAEILNTILSSKTEDELRASMETLCDIYPIRIYFSFGFGSHHMWVHENLRPETPQNKRLIFVEF